MNEACESCGETESNLEPCIGCDKLICIDNCRAAFDDEHGVSWCHECYERERDVDEAMGRIYEQIDRS
jgi:hypothetical protein